MTAAKFASSELDVFSKTELEHMAAAFVWHSERRGVPGSLNHNHCTAKVSLQGTSDANSTLGKTVKATDRPLQ